MELVRIYVAWCVKNNKHIVARESGGIPLRKILKITCIEIGNKLSC